MLKREGLKKDVEVGLPAKQMATISVISMALTGCSSFVERYPQYTELSQCLYGTLPPFLVIAGLSAAVYLMSRKRWR